MSQVDTMARKSAPKGKPAGPAAVDRKPMVVQIRGSAEYKKWAEGLADREGFSVAMLFERAVRKMALEAGYPAPPKR
jgi:hypothetical protein